MLAVSAVLRTQASATILLLVMASCRSTPRPRVVDACDVPAPMLSTLQIASDPEPAGRVSGHVTGRRVLRGLPSSRLTLVPIGPASSSALTPVTEQVAYGDS